MKVLVTGAAGQLGRAIVDQFSTDHDVTPLTRRELDLTRDEDVLQAIRQGRPELIINCSAFNDVDGAEDAQVTALDVNAFAVRALARAARELGATFIHYSTDFVFDGTAAAAYAETDRPNPRSVYAFSKLLGEWFAADVERHYVLRVESLFGGPQRRSSTDRIVDAILEGREARVFVDRTVSPSYVVDVARASRRLIELGAPAGLYHCVNDGMVTWHDLARAAAAQLGRAASLVPVSVKDVKLRAARPQFCALSNAKLTAVGIPMPSWRDALARYLALRAIEA